MDQNALRKLFEDTAYVRMGGTKQELACALYLKEQCEALGVEAHLEGFPVQMATVEEASLLADGISIPCKGYYNCGSGTVEAPFVYLPSTDKTSLLRAKDAVVLLDTGIGKFTYGDLIQAGVKGIITYNGDINKADTDIDQKELRAAVQEGQEKLLCVNIHVKDAVRLVERSCRSVKLTVKQEEYMGESRNVVATLPGTGDEWIVLSAHYDSTSLSKGSYDNMSGCVGLLGILKALLPTAPHRYGIKLLFCGSEERGLLGAKAYVRDHEQELDKIALNINLDMIGTYMGKFIACCSCEEKLVHFIQYFSAIKGWGISARQGVYSSDSTPFADKGVPALSFARVASGAIAPIHCAADTLAVLSMEQMQKDIDYLSAFTAQMADAALCPVDREIPEKVKNELDEYNARKRKK